MTNGDFEAGNTGFQSDLPFATQGTRGPGRYWVPNASQNASNFLNQWRGTGNPGSFLLVDNAVATPDPSGQVTAWSQTVQGIEPGRRYCLSLDIMNVWQRGPATLQLEIDGTPAGTRRTLGTGTGAQGVWDSWNVSWTAPAGAPASVVFAVRAGVSGQSGHDFGLDNLRFTPCCGRRSEPDPSFEVQMPACPGGPITATATPGADDLTHQWVVGKASLDDQLQGEETTACWGPTCTLPLEPGACYRVKHGLYNDCQPWVESRKLVCVPKSTGLDERCASPEVCELIECPPGSEPYPEGCSGCGCIRPPDDCEAILAEAGPDRVVCFNSRLSDVSLGMPGRAGCSYAWSPADGLSDPAAAQPTVWWPESRTAVTYTVTATCAAGCELSDSVTVRGGAEAGRLAIQPRGRFFWVPCGGSATLSLSGHSGHVFQWECAPSAGGPWSPCPGAGGQTTYTTGSLRQDLYVRVRARCDDYAPDLSNVVKVHPLCFGWPSDPGPHLDPVDLPAIKLDQDPLGGLVVDLPTPTDAQPPPGISAPPPGEPAAEVPAAKGSEASEPPSAALLDCPTYATAGEPMCACGRFPTEAAMAGVRLDGETLRPLEGTPGRLLFQLPDTLEPGEHTLRGDPEAGFGTEATCSFQVLRLSGSIDQERLFRGQGTDLEIAVEGTRDPVRVRLVNGSPHALRLEGGDEQVATSEGGRKNRIRRNVRGLEKGTFQIDWTLLGTECPCN